MRLPKEILILLLITSALPLARAAILPGSCSHLGDWQEEECNNILLDDSLSLWQKEDLYLNLLESQGKLPSHEFALKWNRGLLFSGPPSNVVPKSSGIIKGAWAKIVSVYKSVFDLNQGNWFVEPEGSVLSAYGYSIELPEGTEAGDCKTVYSLQSSSEALSVFVNGLKAGEGKEVDYLSGAVNGQIMLFEAVLQVNAKLKVDHYRLSEHCFWAGGIFPHYECYSACEFSHTEYRDYAVSHKDSFNATALDAEPGIKIVLEEFSGYRKFKLLVEPTEPLNELSFSIEDNNFSISETNFDLNTSQDIVFVERNQEFSRKTRGFDELDFNALENGYYAVLGTKEAGPCRLTLFTDFEEKQLPCNPIPARQTKLEIETDANTFDLKETVAVKFLLKDEEGNVMPGKELKLEYGAKAKTLTTNDTGVAEAEVGAAESMGFFEASFEPKDIELEEASTVKRASVQNLAAWGTTAQILGFLGSYYLVFLIVKKRLALGV